jgi:hypothetical protein
MIQHQIFGTSFTKNPIFNSPKIENEPFMQRKGKHPKWKLFSIPSRTNVHNIGSFKQTILWIWS